MKKRKVGKSGPTVEDRDPMEAAIMEMAATGELAKPAQLAIRQARRSGLPITFQRGTKIVKQYADGREEVLGEVEMIKFRIPKGVGIIGKK